MVSSLPSHIGEGSDAGRLRIPGQFINPCNKLPCVCVRAVDTRQGSRRRVPQLGFAGSRWADNEARLTRLLFFYKYNFL